MTNDQQPEDSAAPTPGAAEAPTSITPAAAPQPPAPAAPAVPPVQPYQGQEGWQQPPVGPPGVPAAAPAYQAAPQTENVEVGDLSYNALRVYRTNGGRNETILWIANGVPTPVRILQREDGEDRVDLRLIEYQGV